MTSLGEDGLRARSKLGGGPKAPPRPQAIYRLALLERLQALRPDSLLDIGCGDGGLVAAVGAAGLGRAAGLDIDETHVAELRALGLEAHQGRGEALPFPDGSFDVAVLGYTAHHLEDLKQGLREAARVARRGVVVLDPWYDPDVPSQQVAEAFDLWCKGIDRRLGEIHNPCPTAWDLAEPFATAGGYRIEVTHRLILQSIEVGRLAVDGEAQLRRLDGDHDAEASALAALLRRAAAEGVSEDGAILFTAVREA